MAGGEVEIVVVAVIVVVGLNLVVVFEVVNEIGIVVDFQIEVEVWEVGVVIETVVVVVY